MSLACPPAFLLRAGEWRRRNARIVVTLKRPGLRLVPGGNGCTMAMVSTFLPHGGQHNSNSVGHTRTLELRTKSGFRRNKSLPGVLSPKLAWMRLIEAARRGKGMCAKSEPNISSHLLCARPLQSSSGSGLITDALGFRPDDSSQLALFPCSFLKEREDMVGERLFGIPGFKLFPDGIIKRRLIARVQLNKIMCFDVAE